MDWFSISVTVVLGGLVAGFSLMLAVSIVRNLRRGEKYREALERRVNGLRLGAMADHVGLSVVGLVHKAQVLELHRQIERCGECEHTDACDQVLAEASEERAGGNGMPATVPVFCANSDELEQLVRLAPAVS